MKNAAPRETPVESMLVLLPRVVYCDIDRGFTAMRNVSTAVQTERAFVSLLLHA